MTETCTNCQHPIVAGPDTCQGCGATVAASQPQPSIVGFLTQTAPTSIDSSGSNRPSRGVGRRAAMGAALAGLVATGVVGWTFLQSGDGVAGGADAPTAAVEELVAAVEAGDGLAATGFLAPDEVDGAAELLDRTSAYLAELGVDLGSNGTDGVLDVTLSLSDVEAMPLGDHASLVSFEVEGGIELDDTDEGLLGTVLQGDEEARFEADDLRDVSHTVGNSVELVVIELDGRWFVSPMLSIGRELIEREDLPAGRFDLIGQPRPAPADSSTAAVRALLATGTTAGEPISADHLSAVLGGGEGRFFQVFGPAIDQLLADADQSGDGVLTLLSEQTDLELATTDLGDGRVRIDRLAYTIRDTGGDTDDIGTIAVRSDCGWVDLPDEAFGGCIRDLLPETVTDGESFWFATVEEDGGYRVRLMPTLFEVIGRFVGVFDRQTVLDALDMPYADTAAPIEPDTDVTVDFAGQHYVVFDLELRPGVRYTATTDDRPVDVWIESDDFGWYEVGATDFRQYDDTERHARIVVRADYGPDGCDWAGCRSTSTDTTILRIAQTGRLTVDFPQVLAGEIAANSLVVYDLHVVETAEYAIEIEVDGAALGDDTGLVWELDSVPNPQPDVLLASSTHELVLINTTDAAMVFTVTPLTVEAVLPTSPGTEPSGSVPEPTEPSGSVPEPTEPMPPMNAGELITEQTLELTDNTVTANITLPAGDYVAVVSPLAEQDLVIERIGDQCASIDVSFTAPETCAFSTEGGEVPVTITGYVSDTTGELTLAVYEALIPTGPDGALVIPADATEVDRVDLALSALPATHRTTLPAGRYAIEVTGDVGQDLVVELPGTSCAYVDGQYDGDPEICLFDAFGDEVEVSVTGFADSDQQGTATIRIVEL